MRISDWSSDVCSSDLESVREIAEARFPRRHRPAPPPGHPIRIRCGRPDGGAGRCRDTPKGACPNGPSTVTGGFGGEVDVGALGAERRPRSEEHTSELQSLMRSSYAVFCLKKKNIHK